MVRKTTQSQTHESSGEQMSEIVDFSRIDAQGIYLHPESKNDKWNTNSLNLKQTTDAHLLLFDPDYKTIFTQTD